MRTMIVPAAFAAIFGMSAGRARAACQLAQLAKLAARFDHNRPLVEGVVNGRTVWLLVDTGASKSMLFSAAAGRLGLKTTQADGVEFYGVGGKREAMQAFIEELKLGALSAKKLSVFVTESGGAGEREPGGILGRDVLGQGDIEFDLANGLIRLFRPVECQASALAYWSKDFRLASLEPRPDKYSEFRVRVALNGKQVTALLDSGAMTSVVTPAAAAAAGARGLQGGVDGGQIGGLGQRRVASSVASFDSVGIGEETVTNTTLRVSDIFRYTQLSNVESRISRPAMGGDTPMILGADFLGAHRVYVAASQNRLYFTHNGGPIFRTDAEPPFVRAPDPRNGAPRVPSTLGPG